MDEKNKEEYINKIIEVGKRGECTKEELSYFLPTLYGSEIVFTLNEWKLPKEYKSTQSLEYIIRGLHYIELSYRVTTKNDFGFGSPSKTEHLIKYLEKIDSTKAKELYGWVAKNGGNYYIPKDN